MSENKTPILKITGVVDKVYTDTFNKDGKVFTSYIVRLAYDDRYEYKNEDKGKVNRPEFKFWDRTWAKIDNTSEIVRKEKVVISFVIDAVPYQTKDKQGNAITKTIHVMKGIDIELVDKPVSQPVRNASAPIDDYLSDDDDLPF